MLVAIVPDPQGPGRRKRLATALLAQRHRAVALGYRAHLQAGQADEHHQQIVPGIAAMQFQPAHRQRGEQRTERQANAFWIAG